LLRSIGAVTAKEMRVTGLDWTFAPTLAIVRDDRWGRTYEGFGEAPEIAASYAAPLIEGLQGKLGDKDWLRGPHIIATAKHFLGDGGTYGGKDQGDTRISEAGLRDIQCALHSRARCRGAVGHGQFFQLERHQDARQPVAADRGDEAALGL
jgi:beta-glucosidase-like glycosyl hydrolase